MNKELIQKLRDQALTIAMEQLTRGSRYDPREMQERGDQIFAELVVRECLKFIEPMPGSGDVDDEAFAEAQCEILAHFGIE